MILIVFNIMIIKNIRGLSKILPEIASVFFIGGKMLETGTKVPDFELPDQNGKIHKLSDYEGKKVILYFYPKDNTPGCTKQACGFSERYPQFMQKAQSFLGLVKIL